MYLPLTNNPEENFTTPINSIVYAFRQLWNTLGFWTLDIIDSDGNVLVYGVVLVTQINLLSQYPQVPFDLISSTNADPTRNNLDSFLLEIVDK